MYVQIVKFGLDGMDEQQYGELCDALAPAFEAMDGLLTKLWLSDRGAGVFGGVYVWRDRQACAAYQASQVWRDVGAHPNLVDITSEEYELLAGPTALTSGPFAGVRG